MRACLRLTREIFAQKAFEPYRGREIQPGSNVNTDEEIDTFIREKVESAYTPHAPARWGVPWIQWRWSIRRCASSESAACGWSQLGAAFHHDR